VQSESGCDRARNKTAASNLLGDDEWTNHFKQYFRGHKIDRESVCDERQRENADALAKLLLSRFERHLVTNRQLSTKARKASVWNFFRDNLHNMSAMIQLANHVRKGVAHCKAEDSLWNPDIGAFFALPLEQDFDRAPSDTPRFWLGGYYFRDSNSYQMIRSGKSSTYFHNRMTGHHKSASSVEETANSRFYSSYPQDCIKHHFKSRAGTFDELEAYVCLGLNENDLEEISRKFHWETDLEKLWKHDSVYEQNRRKVDLIAYTIELAYELMLAPSADLSESPGYERFIIKYLNP